MRLLVVLLTILAWPLGAAVVLSQEQTRDAVPAAAEIPVIDPSAVAALDRMTAHLQSLDSFEATAETTTEHVLDDGVKVMFPGTMSIKLRRPNGFVIDVSNDRKVRHYYYDGANFTLVAPRQGFYATVDAPATIQETLDQVEERYGLYMPLRDLMSWSAAGHDAATTPFISAMNVGYAKINGVDTGQYLFRTDTVDVQLWIPAGDRPLPQKIVITSLDDAALPQFVANLSWRENPNLAAADFVFTPPPDAKPITIAAYEP